MIITSTHYNRPQCTSEFLKYLEKCDGIMSHTVLFFIEPGCPEVLNLIKQSRLKKVIIQHKDLKGLWVNKKLAIETALDNDDYVLHLEDDVLLSKDAIHYFLWAEKSGEDVFTVSAYNNTSQQNIYLKTHAVGKRRWYTCTGWAIWKDRYESIKDWTGQDADLFNKGHDAQNKYELYPFLSRSQNIGHTSGICSNVEGMLNSLNGEAYALFGLSADGGFHGDFEKYKEEIRKQYEKTGNTVLKDMIDKFDKFTPQNQLITNPLGQELLKLQDGMLKGRNNETYKEKYYLTHWAGMYDYTPGQFYIEA